MSKPPSSSRRWVWVLPSLFLDFIVIALPAGVLPILINEHYGKASYLLLGQAAAAKGVLQFLTSPTLGALSDILGRKWLFLACVIGTASPFAALGLHASLDFHLVLLGLSGLLGATFPLAFAFIADHVSAKERASAFGLAIGTGLGLAYLLGPPLGAAIDRYYGPQAVFNVCAGVLLANILLTACGVREEVRRTPTPPTDQLLRKANPFAAFWMARRKPAMRRLSLIVLFYYFSLWGFVANKSIYARRRFGQSSAQTAAQLSTFGLSSVLAQSVGLRLARQVYTEPEIARRCFACGVAALFLYGAAWEVWMLYVPMVLLGLSLGGFATVSSICSQVVRQVSHESHTSLTRVSHESHTSLTHVSHTSRTRLTHRSHSPFVPFLTRAISPHQCPRINAHLLPPFERAARMRSERRRESSLR